MVPRNILFGLLVLLSSAHLKAQHSTALWDDEHVSAIHLTISPDTLDSIMSNQLGVTYFQGEMIFDDGVNADTVPQVGIRLRGNTSRGAAKKSFKISFNEYVPGRRYQGAKKLNLNAQHNDPTMVREKLFYEVWNKCGMPPRRTTFVRLYINQIFYGLYTCLEELDAPWLSRVFGENDGNFYKCTYPADLAYIDGNQQTYKNIPSATATGGRAYDLQTNDSLDDYSDLVSLITQLDRIPDAQFALEIGQYLDVAGYLKALAIDVATGNWDDYAYNKNNYFLYHRLSTGQFEFVTYDTDNTFGVDWVNRDWATRDCADWLSHSEPRPLASKLLAVPAFRTQYYAYLDTITRLITRPDSIFPRIDSMEAQISPFAATDTFRSLDYGYTLNDFHLGFVGTVDGHTPYGIKPFLQTRYASTIAQLATVQDANGQLSANEISLFPTPVGEGGYLYLHSANSHKSDLDVAIVDAMGHTLAMQRWPRWEPTLQLQVANLPAGHYWVRVEGGGSWLGLGFSRQ